MYVPPYFVQHDPWILQSFVRANSFAALVSAGDDGAPVASHLPLLLDDERGAQGTLVGHLARANPQWQNFDGQHVLAVFSGPHAYISPTWYAEPNAADGTQHVVPTWNYTAIHVYGVCRLEHDINATLAILERYVEFYEANQPAPWKFAGDTAFARRLAEQVVGFHIEITRWEGKWKLGQNHPPERRARTAAALAAQDDRDSQAIAALMRESLDASNGTGPLTH